MLVLILIGKIVCPYVRSVMHSWWYLYLASSDDIVPSPFHWFMIAVSMSFCFRNCGARYRLSSRSSPCLCDCGLNGPISACACSAAKSTASSRVTGWLPPTMLSRPWMYDRCSCTAWLGSSLESFT